MADIIVIEVEAPDALALYKKINANLGFDPATGAGDAPVGLLSHTAGVAEGKIVVTEIWSSKAAQEAFMQGRLGAAFHAADAPQPSRVEWFEVAGSWHTH